MPVVITKLNANDYKFIKSLAEGQGGTIAAYVRMQLKPEISSNLTPAQRHQHLSTNSNNISPFGRIKVILKDKESPN